jgi:hypothetical protein
LALGYRVKIAHAGDCRSLAQRKLIDASTFLSRTEAQVCRQGAEQSLFAWVYVTTRETFLAPHVTRVATASLLGAVVVCVVRNETHPMKVDKLTREDVVKRRLA